MRSGWPAHTASADLSLSVTGSSSRSCFRQLLDAGGEGLEVPSPAARGEQDPDLQAGPLGRADSLLRGLSDVAVGHDQDAPRAAGEGVLEDALHVGAAGRRADAVSQRSKRDGLDAGRVCGVIR
jgi:hypothetical protein